MKVYKVTWTKEISTNPTAALSSAYKKEIRVIGEEYFVDRVGADKRESELFEAARIIRDPIIVTIKEIQVA